MGLSYSNITLKGPSQDALADYLYTEGYTAYISPAVNGCTVVWEESEGTGEPLETLASDLSARFRCSAIAVNVYDSSVLYFQLVENGAQTDEYNSHPSFEINEEPRPPTGGDAHRLCTIFGVPDAEDEI